MRIRKDFLNLQLNQHMQSDQFDTISDRNRNVVRLKHTSYLKSPFLSRPQKSKSSVCIEISISTMFSNPLMTTELLSFAKDLSQQSIVPILIADRLNQFNEFAFGDRSLETGAAARRALRDGYEIKIRLQKIIQDSFVHESSKRFEILNWDDIQCSEYNLDIATLQGEFESNLNFRTDVIVVAEEFFRKRSFAGKQLTRPRLEALVTYIIWELPLVLKGFQHRDVHFNTALHPIRKPGPPTELEKLVLRINTTEDYAKLRQSLKICNPRTWIDVFES